jgi:S-(hydroxymethyl)glutathione dehydrogenase/alcohol dehydrogenase
MKAAILFEINKDPEIRDVKPLGPSYGQVLVKIIQSGICGAQLQEISGYKNNSKFLPHLLGHEGFGRVEQIGAGVTNVNVGDFVVLHWRPGRGIESDFPRYQFEDKELTSGKVTTLSEYSLASENRVTRVDPATDPSMGAMIGCSSSTAFSILEHEISLAANNSVLVIGAGGVGLNLILGAAMEEVETIGVLERNPSKEILSRRLGATTFYSNENQVADKFDYILDTTGDINILQRTLGWMKGGGCLVLIGQPKPGAQLVFDEGIRMFDGSGITIKATQGGGFVPQRDLIRYLDKLQRNLSQARHIVTHTFELSELSEALNTLRLGEAGRIMISYS